MDPKTESTESSPERIIFNEEHTGILIRAAREFKISSRKILETVRSGLWDTLTDTPPEKPLDDLNMKLHGNSEILDLLSAENIGARKVWLIFTAGAQQASITAGVLRGMRESGLLVDKNIAGVIGVSAGATSIIGLWGNNLDAAEIYSQEHTEPGGFNRLPKTFKEAFILIKNILTKGGPETAIINTSIAAEVMKSGKRPIDIEAIRNSEVGELLMLTMNAETGDPYYADLKKLPDNPIDIMDAAITVPGVNVKPWVVMNDGKKLCDGAFTEDNIPIAEAFRRGATDVLIFGNRPFGEIGSSMGLSASEVNIYVHALLSTNRQGYPRRVINLIRRGGEINRRANRELQGYLNRNDPQQRILVIAPENEVLSKLDQRREAIEKAAAEAREFGLSLKSRITSKVKELVGV